jgi:hypothetical protein
MRTSEALAVGQDEQPCDVNSSTTFKGCEKVSAMAAGATTPSAARVRQIILRDANLMNTM